MNSFFYSNENFNILFKLLKSYINIKYKEDINDSFYIIKLLTDMDYIYNHYFNKVEYNFNGFKSLNKKCISKFLKEYNNRYTIEHTKNLKEHNKFNKRFDFFINKNKELNQQKKELFTIKENTNNITNNTNNITKNKPKLNIINNNLKLIKPSFSDNRNLLQKEIIQLNNKSNPSLFYNYKSKLPYFDANADIKKFKKDIVKYNKKTDQELIYNLEGEQGYEYIEEYFNIDSRLRDKTIWKNSTKYLIHFVSSPGRSQTNVQHIFTDIKEISLISASFGYDRHENTISDNLSNHPYLLLYIPEINGSLSNTESEKLYFSKMYTNYKFIKYNSASNRLIKNKYIPYKIPQFLKKMYQEYALKTLKGLTLEICNYSGDIIDNGQDVFEIDTWNIDDDNKVYFTLSTDNLSLYNNGDPIVSKDISNSNSIGDIIYIEDIEFDPSFFLSNYITMKQLTDILTNKSGIMINNDSNKFYIIYNNNNLKITIPSITNITLDSYNASVQITFSEEVFTNNNGSGTLSINDFILSISGGVATVNSTPSNITSDGSNKYTLTLNLSGTPNGNELLTVNPKKNSIFGSSGNIVSNIQLNNSINLNLVNFPTISSTTIESDNSFITVTFSESVYNTTSGIDNVNNLEVGDFSLSLSSGSAILSSTTPSSITRVSQSQYKLYFSYSNLADGTEVLTVNPIINSIYNSSDNSASISQSNNTVTFNEYPNSSSGNIWKDITLSANAGKMAAFVEDSNIFISTNTGTTWTEDSSVGSTKIWKTITSDSNNVNLAAAVYSDNNKYNITINWNKVFNNANVMLAVGTSADLWRSTNNGTSWGKVTTSNDSYDNTLTWKAIDSSTSGEKLVACVYGGNIWTSTDSGDTWTEDADVGLTKNWNDLTSSNTGAEIYSIVKNGYIWKSTDTGSNWTQLTDSAINSAKDWEAISTDKNGEYTAAVVYGGYIYISDNSGNWTEITSTSTQNWKGISVSSQSGQRIFAAAYGGNIWKSTNYGVTWTMIEGDISSTKNWNDISVNKIGRKMAAVVYGGNIWISTNYGNNWVEKSVGGRVRNWTSVSIDPSGTYIVASEENGNLWTSGNTGTDWSSTYDWVSQGGNIWTSTDSGSNWAQKTGPGISGSNIDYSHNWTKILYNSSGLRLYALSENYNFYKSTDYGVTWSELAHKRDDNTSAIPFDSSSFLISNKLKINKDNYISFETSGSGTGAIINEVKINSGNVLYFKVKNGPGSGYLENDTITISIDGIALDSYTITSTDISNLTFNGSGGNINSGSLPGNSNSIADGTYYYYNINPVFVSIGINSYSNNIIYLGVDDGGNIINWTTLTDEITNTTNNSGSGAIVSQVIISGGNVTSFTLRSSYGSGYAESDLFTISINGVALGSYTITSTDISNSTFNGSGGTVNSGSLPGNSNNIADGTYYYNINSVFVSIGINSYSNNIIYLGVDDGGNIINWTTLTDEITNTTNNSGSGAIVSQVIISGGNVTSFTLRSSYGSGYAESDLFTISINGVALGSYTITSTDISNSTFNGSGGTITTNLPDNSNSIANRIYPIGNINDTDPQPYNVAINYNGRELAVVLNPDTSDNISNIWTASKSGSDWTWTERTGPNATGSGMTESVSWEDITMSLDGTKIAAIENTNIWVSYDSGDTWTEENSNVSSQIWNKIEISTNGNILTAISDNWIYKSEADSSGEFTTWGRIK